MKEVTATIKDAWQARVPFFVKEGLLWTESKWRSHGFKVKEGAKGVSCDYVAPRGFTLLCTKYRANEVEPRWCRKGNARTLHYNMIFG